MQSHDDGAFELLIRKLKGLMTLEEGAREAIAKLPSSLSTVRRGCYLVREGDDVTDCCVLLAGFACRHKLSSDGGRQIVSFHLPGDILDIQHLQLPRADHNVQTITEATVAWIPLAELQRVADVYPSINKALWRDALIDASIFREWVLNVGRRDAKSRVAHMLCEFAARREAAGLGAPERLELPMTQEDIADATGLTPVHVNRMLRALRNDGTIEGAGREIQIANWERMRRAAGFDRAYLHQAA